MIRKTLLLQLFILLTLTLQAQLTLKITSLPSNTPADATLYFAGNINGWDAGNAAFALTDNQDGTYEITLNPPAGLVEYKFTRGSWATVEGNESGGFRPNRTYNYTSAPVTVEQAILSWEDLGGGGGSTAAGNVTVIANDFYMPQLDRTRRIWIYLPPDYEETDHSYPVLYMHDGQNVFDAATSFAGEWEVDESLNDLFADGDEGIIVVAIDNGGGERINEYSPWVNPQYGGGDGEAYMDFIVETLKPHIDAHYRTRPQREYTGIMGSSMGAIISMYGAMEHQEVFSKAGIFSPAFWFSSQCYTHVSETGKQADMRFFLLAGEQEGNGSVAADVNAMYNTLLNAGFSPSEINVVTHPDGQHSEWYWAREFPDAYLWLFAESTSSGSEPMPLDRVRLYPNPADSILYLESEATLEDPHWMVFSVDGRIIQPATFFSGDAINVSFLQPGLYTILVYDKEQIVGSQRIIVK